MITVALAESEGFTEMPPAVVTLTLISLHFSKSSDTAFAQSESDPRKDMICLRQASRAASPPGSPARSLANCESCKSMVPRLNQCLVHWQRNRGRRKSNRASAPVAFTYLP